MATKWIEADHSERVTDDESTRVLRHLSDLGVLTEASAVMEAISNGSDERPLVAPDEVRRRLLALVGD